MAVNHSFAPLPHAAPLVLLWQSRWSERNQPNTLEHVLVRPGLASGVIVGVDESGTPCRIHYEIEWDESWCTREVDIDAVIGDTAHALHLSVDETTRWFDGDGRELEELAGCYDVDIWPTPLTNTLALRRMQLLPGEREMITVAWVNALTGELKTERQGYTCLDAGAYRFENLAGGFSAELMVDDYGFVIDYPPLFSRVAATALPRVD